MDLNEMRMNNLKGNKWTIEEIEKLKEIFPNTDSAEVANELGRTLGAVQAKAHMLGVYKIEKEDLWDRDSILEFAQNFYNKYGHAPAKPDYNGTNIKLDAPSEDYLYKHFTGSLEVNDILGIPTVREFKQAKLKQQRLQASFDYIKEFNDKYGKYPFPIEYDANRPNLAYNRRTLEKNLGKTLLRITEDVLEFKKFCFVKDVSKQDLANYILDLHLTHKPEFKEIKEHFNIDGQSLYVVMGCSFPEFCNSIGCESARKDSTPKSKEFMDSKLKELSIELGRAPTTKEIDEKSGFTISTLLREYDSIEEACLANGIEYIPYNLGLGRISFDKNGELCRSAGEEEISNFLIDNNINFVKEVPYNDLYDCENDRWRCDWFIVPNEGLGYIVEYFGLVLEDYLIKTEKKINSLSNSKYENNYVAIYPKDLSNKKLKELFAPVFNDIDNKDEVC